MIKAVANVLSLVIAISVAGPATARSVIVRSGEHSTFTRLVFPDTPGRSWEVTERDGEVEIYFSEGLPDLDLGQVFDFIPRDRLATISTRDRTLVLGLPCRCSVSVSQISSGHIVLDISDPSSETAPPEERRIVSAPRLTLTPLPFPVLGEMHRAEVTAADIPPLSDFANRPSAVQIRRHPLGRVPLVMAPSTAGSEIEAEEQCEIDDFASDILSTDPTNSFADLKQARSSLLSGSDVLDGRAVARLTRIYLSLGWGAEAVMNARSAGTVSPETMMIAAAVDGTPLPSDLRADPGCGPGAALIALLTGVTRADWKRADEADVIGLLYTFSDRRWFDLHDRLLGALAGLGRDSLLTGLGPIPSNAADERSDVSTAAGTDAKAISAAIDILSNANADDQPSDMLQIENARALRPSVPAGPLRAALDETLLKALILARQPVPAVRMVEDGHAKAEKTFDLVTRHLALEEAVEFIVRLEPLLESDDPIRLRARDLLLELSLPNAAERFAPPPGAEEPVEVAEPLTATEPWLERDFSALAEDGIPDWTVRNDVAAAILARNRPRPPQPDLAAAESSLARSRETGALVRRLLSQP